MIMIEGQVVLVGRLNVLSVCLWGWANEGTIFVASFLPPYFERQYIYCNGNPEPTVNERIAFHRRRPQGFGSLPLAKLNLT